MASAKEKMLAWAPFLASSMVRISVLLYVVCLLERRFFGFTGAVVASAVFYIVAASVGVAVLRSLLGGAFLGQTPDLKVQTETGTLRSETVEYAACSMRGWRPAMEDAHVVEMLSSALLKDVGLFAVLDGHGGHQVSALAAELLADEVVAAVTSQFANITRVQSLPDDPDYFQPALGEALHAALPRLDARMRLGALGLGRLLPGLLHPFCHEGSTACVAAVDFSKQEIVTANIGDSRGILIRDGKAINLSTDHKPEDKLEKRRIEHAGGQVVNRGDCWRIDGILNLSRALGDYYMKANPSLPADKQKVSPFPDITKQTFRAKEQDLLVLACDGLFEKKQNQDIADFIWPRFKEGQPLQKIGEELLRACCARGTMRGGRAIPIELGTDNETVIIIKLPVSKAADVHQNGNDVAMSNGAKQRRNGAEDIPKMTDMK